MAGMVYLTIYSSLFIALLSAFAAVYFVLQTPRLLPEYKLLTTLNAIICLFSAAVHGYYFIETQQYLANAQAIGQVADRIANLPLELRYAYWVITTVMLIIMFPLLAGIKRIGVGVMIELAIADAAMIITGYVGERSMIEAGRVTDWGIWMFVVSCVFWLYMIVRIFFMLRSLKSHELSRALRDALAYMFFFIILGWTIYPAGYFNAVIFDDAIGVVLREFSFNLGDIVNKVVWGFVVVLAARTVSEAASQAEERPTTARAAAVSTD